jgi:hypothetical protein
MGVDILITGHTHETKASILCLPCRIGDWSCWGACIGKCAHHALFVCWLQITNTENGLQILLGSATGAYSSLREDPTPSFVLLDVDGSSVSGKMMVLSRMLLQ